MFQFLAPIVPKCTGLGYPGSETFCSICDFLTLLDNLIKFLASLAPFIVMVFIAWGGLKIIMSGGNMARIGEGRKIISTALWGLAIVIGAWLIISTIFHIFTGEVSYPWYSIQC